MKGLVIENEWELDIEIQAFLKDHPKLFSSVNEQLYCLNRSLEELIPHVLETDAIIVSSTWMYKDQLEDYLDAFLSPKFPKKLKFYIHHILNKLNDWKADSWRGEKEIFAKIKQLVKNGHEIYDFREGEGESTIFDGLTYLASRGHNDHGRAATAIYKVEYSEQFDLFYLPDNEYHTLEKEIEDEQDRKRRDS